MKFLKVTMIMVGILAMASSCKDSDKIDAENDQVAVESPDYDMDNRAEATSVTEDILVVDNDYLLYSTEEMEDIYESLDMSEDQINQFEADFNKKMDAMVHDSAISVDKEKMQPEMDKSLKTVLTAEQFAKYENWKKDNSNM